MDKSEILDSIRRIAAAGNGKAPGSQRVATEAQKEAPPEAFPDIETLHSAWITIVRDEQAFIDTLNDDVLNGLRSFDSYRVSRGSFLLPRRCAMS